MKVKRIGAKRKKKEKKRDNYEGADTDSQGRSYGPMPPRKTALCVPPFHREQVQMEKNILLAASSLSPELDTVNHSETRTFAIFHVKGPDGFYT